MTLPFRRRHHDNESAHDRARAVVAAGFLEPNDPADEEWLAGHLEACGECRVEMDAYRADRELLRGLRTDTAEPPRDLWARTAAAIEQEAGRRDRGDRSVVRGARLGRMPLGRVPLGVLSGALVVLVVVGTSLMPRGGPGPIGPTGPAGSDIAVVTPLPEATPLAVTAQGLTWVQESGDGTFQLVFANVQSVCTSTAEACAPIDDGSSARLTLESEPQAVVISPTNEQIVVFSGSDTPGGGDVFIVAVPTPAPSPDPSGSPVAETPKPTPTPTRTPTPTPTPTARPTPSPDPNVTPDPNATPTPLPSPSVSPDPNAPRAILTGVVVVGEASYSADGQWLAFSARPIDGSAGPDLYLWRVGDPVASAITADHRTFFAGWLGNLVLASTVLVSADPGEPAASADPVASPASTATPDPSAPPVEDHPISFLLDPASAAVIQLAGADVWRPIVDPTSRTIVYWAGTLVPDGTGTGWVLGTGRLVMDAWNPSSDFPAATPDPSATPELKPSTDPGASAKPVFLPGPAGKPITLAEGPIGDFDASFDPSGTRLAVWVGDPKVGDPGASGVGTLRLVALDKETTAPKLDVDPLPGVIALRGFSIGEGRLVWVTPPGQDGDASHLQVLAWSGDEFGQVQSDAAEGLFVVR